MSTYDILKNGIEYYKLDVTEKQIGQFKTYFEMLVEWNKKINLTAIVDEKEVYEKHFLDSISCVQSGIDLRGKSIIDVGTGAGFPGVPLKIMFPDIKLTLLDSLNKRVLFLTELAKSINIECHIIHGRAEDMGKDKLHREKYDVSVSRAVANLSVLAEYTLPFVKVGGYFLCQKGPSVFEEISGAQKAISVLGGEIVDTVSTKIFNTELNHHITVIKKTTPCPGKYPRKAGMVEKNPIK